MIKFIALILPLTLAFIVAMVAMIVVGIPIFLIMIFEQRMEKKRTRGYYTVLGRELRRLAFL